jgi:hypothetical protein
MLYEANVYQTTYFWIAESKVLKGCVGQGETLTCAISELEANENEWLDTAIKYGIAIPPQ